LVPRCESSSPAWASRFRILLTVGTGRPVASETSGAVTNSPGRVASWVIMTMP